MLEASGWEGEIYLHTPELWEARDEPLGFRKLEALQASGLRIYLHTPEL
jgi:hypothetical protein